MSSGEVTVTGGVTGIEAREEALERLAAACDAAGDHVRGLAARLLALLADPALVASTPLAPVSAAAVAARLGATATGPTGAVAVALLLEADAAGVRGARRCLAAADALVEEAVTRLDTSVVLAGGALAAVTAPAWLPGAAAHHGQVGDGVQATLVAEPGVVDHLVRGGAGLSACLGPLPPSALGLPAVPAVAGGLAGLYRRGGGRAEARDDLALPAGAPPDLRALTDHLAAVAALGGTGGGGGTIEVQTLHTAHGVRHVVYLPGTDDMTTLPWQRDADVRDFGTNLELVGGRGTAYGDGVRDALRQAGVRPDEPVLLVGHSQGGLLAGSIAAAGGDGYDVVGAVTLGAPLATLPHLPDGVGVLALENSHDVVPHLDGHANPGEIGLVTVTADGGGDDVAGAHSYAAYAAVAGAADASRHPAVAAQVAAFDAEGFLGGAAGAATTSRVFRITRVG